jgi:hypothetical protein
VSKLTEISIKTYLKLILPIYFLNLLDALGYKNIYFKNEKNKLNKDSKLESFLSMDPLRTAEWVFFELKNYSNNLI